MESKKDEFQQPEEEKFGSTDDSASIGGKQVRDLTNIELIKRAEECVETLELEKAVALYHEGVQRFPNDTVILDGYSELLIQLGELEKAKEVSQFAC